MKRRTKSQITKEKRIVSSIPITEIRNYVFQDPVLDYFALTTPREINSDGFVSRLSNQSVDFRRAIFNKLQMKFPENSQFANNDPETTLILKERRTPLIFLGNVTSSFFVGTVDLLILDSWIPKVLNLEETGVDGYSLVNFCCHKMEFRKDSRKLLSSDSNRYSQLKLIGLSPSRRSYLWGKDDRIAIVDPSPEDRDHLNEARSWLLKLKRFWKTWTLEPIPSVVELYPNMKNHADQPYHDLKCALAKSINEITSVFYCGVRHRKAAFEHGIRSWKDPRLTAKIMGIDGKIIGSRVDQMLDFQRGHHETLNWSDSCSFTKAKFPIFLDIEFISGGLTPGSPIYMIGVGYLNSGYHQKTFVSDSLSIESQELLVSEYSTWVDNLIGDQDAIIYHWGDVERSRLPSKYTYFDLHKFMLENDIFVPGCLDFKLKHVISALCQLDIIQWKPSSGCDNGLDSISLALDAFEQGADLTRLIQYNSDDCHSLYQIYHLLGEYYGESDEEESEEDEEESEEISEEDEEKFRRLENLTEDELVQLRDIFIKIKDQGFLLKKILSWEGPDKDKINLFRRYSDFRLLDPLGVEAGDAIQQIETFINGGEYKDLEKNLPKHPHGEKIQEELQALKLMKKTSSEYSKKFAWLNFVTKLPTEVRPSRPIEDLGLFEDQVRSELDRSCTGMDEVKELIIDYLFKRISNPKSNNSIIAFYGPKGVGKTQLANTVAKILDLPIVKVSLGGASDGTILTGHSTTYIGAIPGSITKGLVSSKCINPIVYLDEIDKICARKGDYSEINGILTHLLDPLSNSEFIDDYVGFPIDLSQVLWMVTFNDPNKIDPIVRDRLTMIEVPGYSKKEKVAIAKNHLIPAINDNLRADNQIKISDQEILQIVELTESEEGVRNLKRNLELLFNRMNRRRLVSKGTIIIGKDDVDRILTSRSAKIPSVVSHIYL